MAVWLKKTLRYAVKDDHIIFYFNEESFFLNKKLARKSHG